MKAFPVKTSTNSVSSVWRLTYFSSSDKTPLINLSGVRFRLYSVVRKRDYTLILDKSGSFPTKRLNYAVGKDEFQALKNKKIQFPTKRLDPVFGKG